MVVLTHWCTHARTHISRRTSHAMRMVILTVLLTKPQVLNEDIGQQGAQYTAYTQLVVHTNGASSETDSTGGGASATRIGTVAGAVAGAVVGAIATKLAKL